MMSLRERLDAVREHGDAGWTLLEMVVAMVITAVFMAIFTTSMYLMTSNQTKMQSVADSVGQTNKAFLYIDRTMRYASAISTPATSSGGTWHVEYDVPLNTNGVSSDRCTQLAINGTKLQQRTWDPATVSAKNPPSWITLSSFVTNGTAASSSTDAPFVLPKTGSGSASSLYQKLTVTLIATAGNSFKATSRTSMTFVALNSTAGVTTPTCQQISVDT